MNKTIKYTLLYLLFLFSNKYIIAQVIYTPLNSPIYNFLDRIADEGIINLNDEVKPYSRIQIAEYIKSAEGKIFELNKVEQDELYWYNEEYAKELKVEKERWFLYKYSDSLFSIRVSPIGGYGISKTGNASGHTRWWGVNTYGTVSDWFGAFFSYRDIGQFGDNVDEKKDFTPERGYYINAYPADGIEFSDVKGGINFNWKWGSASLIKDDIQWGHGKFGQLILSDKPESYPQIRLFLQPVSWIRFYYMHGWLNSLVLDSAFFYNAQPISIKPTFHQQYISKYIAANMLSISPIDKLDISIGNSVIYSGNLRPEFFIPFLYYKVMDHNTGRGNIDDANGQIYFDISSRNLINYQIYSTVFIDAASIRGLLKGDFHEWWLGYTLGIKRVNLGIPNLDFTFEYTWISPWVYEHKYDTETYKNIGYTLGDWLGQNADQIRVQADYKPTRPLTISCYFQRLRKGGLADIAITYYTNITEPFLYAPVRKDYDFGINAEYEWLHDLFINVSYEYTNIQDQDLTRTPAFMLGVKNNLSLTVSLGL